MIVADQSLRGKPEGLGWSRIGTVVIARGAVWQDLSGDERAFYGQRLVTGSVGDGRGAVDWRGTRHAGIDGSFSTVDTIKLGDGVRDMDADVPVSD